MATEPQTIGIVGAGNIGGTLAKLLDAAEYRVRIANSRGPETLEGLIAGLSPQAEAATVEDAIGAADVVIEAVPFGRIGELPRGALKGKTLVSASNYYPSRDGEIDLEGLSQTGLVARKLAGARVVKAFNTIYWEHLRDQGDPSLELDERRVIPIAGDDPAAVDTVAMLVARLGFGALRLGGLDAAKGIAEPGGTLYNVDLTLAEARRLVDQKT